MKNWMFFSKIGFLIDVISSFIVLGNVIGVNCILFSDFLNTDTRLSGLIAIFLLKFSSKWIR